MFKSSFKAIIGSLVLSLMILTSLSSCSVRKSQRVKKKNINSEDPLQLDDALDDVIFIN